MAVVESVDFFSANGGDQLGTGLPDKYFFTGITFMVEAAFDIFC